MNHYFKFACIYCGQHMECKPAHCGRQIQCPACLHRIVIPPSPAQRAAGHVQRTLDGWDTWIPLPIVKILRPRQHRATELTLRREHQRQNDLHTPAGPRLAQCHLQASGRSP